MTVIYRQLYSMGQRIVYMINYLQIIALLLIFPANDQSHLQHTVYGVP